MRDPLVPSENENSGAPMVTLRGTALDLRAALADLLAFGPAAASRWGIAAPALTPQELDAIHEAAMRDAAAREMLAEAGWAGALERRSRPEASAGPQPLLTAPQRALILALSATCAVFAMWAGL